MRVWAKQRLSRSVSKSCPEPCPELGRNNPSEPHRTRPKAEQSRRQALQIGNYGTEGDLAPEEVAVGKEPAR